MSIMNKTPIILLHGLRSLPLTMTPLQQFLKIKGKFENIHNIRYRVNDVTFDESINMLDTKLSKLIDKDNDRPIIVGQSMGGVMGNNLHKYGWNIAKSITIGSPLHGARILNMLDNNLPQYIKDMFFIEPYFYLMNKDSDKIPPHPYHCITMSLPFSNFDGCVFVDEAKFEDQHHTHLNNAHHITVFGNPKLFNIVLREIKNIQ